MDLGAAIDCMSLMLLPWYGFFYFFFLVSLLSFWVMENGCAL
jgi:hypothetical protein